MLVLNREQQTFEDHCFRDLPRYLRPGDCLVLNQSKVFPSRLFGRRAGVHSLAVGKRNPKRQEHLSGQVEVFLLRTVSADAKTWEALVRPGRKLAVGERIRFDEAEVEIVGRGEFGLRTLRFEYAGDIWTLLNRIGHVPLPPYIKRADTPDDRDRYQTVFASEVGSVAAPTAGLHFTPEVLQACHDAGAEIARVTLHVGLGTFQPLHAEQLSDVKLHAEHYEISPEASARIRAAQRRVVIGTTSVRTLESGALRNHLMPGSGETDLFISPGFSFQATDVLLTNFHLPGSSLLMLVCAFAGYELTMRAYQHALAEKYRFFSYGDCMLVL